MTEGGVDRGVPAARPIDAPIERTVTPLIRACAFVAWWFAKAMTRIRVEGAIGEIPMDGPLIIAANHASNFDPVVLGSWIVPRLGRRMHWLGKKELFDWPIIGYLARHGGIHPVDRDAADVEAFRLARRILDDDQVLFVFPEGTRSPDGALQHARDGVGVLALRTGATILPVGIGGSDRVWPRGQRWPHPGGHVTLRIGRPFRVEDAIPAGSDRRQAKTLATDLIMRRIAAQLPERQRGAYAAGDLAADLPADPPADGPSEPTPGGG